jgi:hypothetical protein
VPNLDIPLFYRRARESPRVCLRADQASAVHARPGEAARSPMSFHLVQVAGDRTRSTRRKGQDARLGPLARRDRGGSAVGGDS